MQELNDGVVKLSNSTGKSAVELSEAMYSALSAGVDVGNSLSFVEQSSKLATAGFTTTESAVDALTTVMNGYKMSADQATAVSDMMLQTQNKGKTTVDELAHSLAQVTPTAAAMSVYLLNSVRAEHKQIKHLVKQQKELNTLENHSKI